MKHKIEKSLLLLVILVAAATVVSAQEIARITTQPINVIYVTDTAVTMESFSPKMVPDCSHWWSQKRSPW